MTMNNIRYAIIPRWAKNSSILILLIFLAHIMRARISQPTSTKPISSVAAIPEPVVTPAATVLIGDDGRGTGSKLDEALHGGISGCNYLTLNHAPQELQSHSQRSFGWVNSSLPHIGQNLTFAKSASRTNQGFTEPPHTSARASVALRFQESLKRLVDNQG